MVGGIVIGIARQADSTLVHVQGTGCEKGSTCSIRVEERRASDGRPCWIEPGDSIWWQGRRAMWTPRDKSRVPGIDAMSEVELQAGQGLLFDILLPRIGCSH